MERILEELDDVADRVKSLENKREKLGVFLREIKSAEIQKDMDILEKRLAIPVEKDSLETMRVVGVDGGLIKRAYHAVDLILTRAVAAIFDYEDAKLANVSYHPDPLTTPRLETITDPYSETDFHHRADIERIITEVVVLDAVQELDPDLVLADGSLVPHPSTRPNKGTEVWERYRALLEGYRKLYSSADGNLAGIVEDSRSTHFAELVAERILSNVDGATPELRNVLSRTRDTNLLFHALKEGERSFVFRLGDPQKNPVMKDLGELSSNLYAFYLKTVEFDRPIRVEFYARGDAVKTADRLASQILPISCHNQEYGIPGVIIEADSRAKLRPEELTTIHGRIVDRTGNLPSLFKLRRDNRPF